MSAGSFLDEKSYVRQRYVTKNNLHKIYNGNGNDPPEDVPEALMDGCPPEWGASPWDFCPMWLKLLILAKKTFLIRVKRNGGLSRG